MLSYLSMSLPVSHEALSQISGSVSIACWAMIFSPQFLDIFLRQNADNLSVSFLWLWFAGDVANIIGCIRQEVLPTMTILAVYNALADIVLIFQASYYRHRRLRRLFLTYSSETSRKKQAQQTAESESEDDLSGSFGISVDKDEYEYFQSLIIPPRRVWKYAFFKFFVIFIIVLSSIIGLYCATKGHIYESPMKYYNPTVLLDYYGQLCGWFCAGLYTISRVPQIFLNYKQKSCDATSIIHFFFASTANFMFIASILLLDHSAHYLQLNSSWLCGAASSLALDYVIVIQSWYYNPSRFEITEEKEVNARELLRRKNSPNSKKVI
ncbi:hypothetical protein V1514DRAFT_368155 [Lipomyces japonicus]|uniref:uncharacterized protein n=1 Tax=Lipomyces japonicus TaxID=56871 RepID=UPI0034CEAA7E